MILGIDEKDMLDNSKLKIIDSIAGAGKGVMINEFLRTNGIEYLRLTSTNTLKKDATERFGGNVKTICAGLFDNSEGFRTAEKEIEGFSTIVIDEILQDSFQAVKWVENHMGSGLNIIVTTDSRQMLPVEGSEITLKAFENLKTMPNVIYSNIDVTLRGNNQETRNKVRELYKMDGYTRGINLMKEYSCVPIDAVEFDPNNVYLCHTNEIEHELYKRFDLSNCELIGKGQQSGKEPVRGKYPLMDEQTAKLKHVISYYQAKNIASVTRYQGSEVAQGATGYYFIESKSVVTMREFYTVVSRFKDYKNLVIVQCDDIEKPYELTEWKGKKVKEMRSLIIAQFDGTMHIVNDEEMIAALAANTTDTTVYYDIDCIYAVVDDKMYCQYINEKSLNKFQRTHCMELNGNLYIDLKAKPNFKSLAGTLSKKTPSIQYDFTPQIYEIVGDTFKAPMLKNTCKKAGFEHQADLFSAYGTVIKNSPMPNTKALYREYRDDKLNFYICNSEKLAGKNNLITEELAKTLNMDKCEFAFATDYQQSNEIGDFVYAQSRKSKEAKKNMKMHWGYFEKHYIENRKTGHVENGESIVDIVPVMNPQNINELFMCAVKSSLANIMIKARDSVGGGYVCTDAIYYNGDKKPDLPSWAWYRISKGGKHEGEYEDVEYQNYEDLKTNSQLYEEKRKAKFEAMSTAEKDEAKAKKAERERARRAAKKAAETPEQAEERRRKERERKQKQRQQ